MTMIDLHALIGAYAECVLAAGFVGTLTCLLGLASRRNK